MVVPKCTGLLAVKWAGGKAQEGLAAGCRVMQARTTSRGLLPRARALTT